MRWKNDKSLGADAFLKTSQQTRRRPGSRAVVSSTELLGELVLGPRAVKELQVALPGASIVLKRLVLADLVDVDDNDMASLTDEGQAFLKQNL